MAEAQRPPSGLSAWASRLLRAWTIAAPAAVVRCAPSCSAHLLLPPSQGTNPENLKWFVEGELTNGRWAMAAVAGILFTDLVGLPKFWLAGAEVRRRDPGGGRRWRQRRPIGANGGPTGL
jgi:hypothetical protein